ncbi:hypothetical protein L2E82_27191 [Cichorium intybus]|uniref:Uncharacterized protein n=1 Tax=Cichorium intybus TaxID=13427 RepID=A0ACB9CSL5_CICIN|nr:hypothetical protein L2E82_27191 [Cichorium intybus]
MAKKLNFLALFLFLLAISFCFLAPGIETAEAPGTGDSKKEGPSPKGPGHHAEGPEFNDNKKEGPSPRGPGHHAEGPEFNDNKKVGPSPKGPGLENMMEGPSPRGDCSGGSRIEKIGARAAAVWLSSFLSPDNSGCHLSISVSRL